MTPRSSSAGLFLLSALVAAPAFADAPLHGAPPARPLPSPHLEDLLRHRNAPAPVPSDATPALAPAAAGPDVTVYGYWPYWGDDISTVRFDSLSHLAIFSVTLNADGTMANTQYWTNVAARAISLARPYGVKVHLCMTGFDTNVMNSVFPSASKRATAVNTLKQLIDTYGADGVNIDVEGLPSSQKANFVSFIKELNAAIPEVYIATPAVDWSGAYDYDQLALNSDGLFIMGYGYHYSGGNPGPIAPLFGGSPWGSYSLEWSVDDYLTWGTPQDKVILGLPLYGYSWPTTNNTVPGTSTGSGTAQFYTAAVANGLKYGRKWDTVTHTPYAFPSTTSQLWYDDVESIEDKVAWALEQGIQGVGFWALTYEDADPTFWNAVDGLTTAPACPDADGDGASSCDGDCDDADPTTFPGAVERCDGIDNNCDALPDNAIDEDGDGANACLDCDDTDPGTGPGAEEVPRDGIDNDCDGEIDEAPGTGCGGARYPFGQTGQLGVGLLGLAGLWRIARRRARRQG